MAKKLPKRIFVKREIDGELEYLCADEDIQNLSEKDETLTVGEYQLKTTHKLVNLTKLD